MLKRDNNECQHCKAKGEFSPADTVHHIKHVRQWPEYALDDENLISLCSSCHWDEHHQIDERSLLNEEKW